MITYDPFWRTLRNSKETTYTLITKHHISNSTIHRLRKNMKLTPEDLIKQGIIDKIIPEVRTSAEIKQFKAQLFDKMEELRAMPEQEMLQKRFTRYRGF